MNDDRIFLTPEEAISLLGDREEIHTFRNPSGMLIGADWGRKSLIQALRAAGPEEIEIGGDACKSMKHGLILHSNGPLFIECDTAELEALESLRTINRS